MSGARTPLRGTMGAWGWGVSGAQKCFPAVSTPAHCARDVFALLPLLSLPGDLPGGAHGWILQGMRGGSVVTREQGGMLVLWACHPQGSADPSSAPLTSCSSSWVLWGWVPSSPRASPAARIGARPCSLAGIKSQEMPSEPQEGARGQHGSLAETLVPAGLRQLLGGGWELGSWVLQAAWKTSG